METLVKISSKGQVTIPKKIREFLGTNLIKFKVIDGKVVIEPVKDVGGILKKYVKKSLEKQYQEIRPFFESLRNGTHLLSEVLLETFYILTKVYKIPDKKAAEILKDLILYRGIINKDKEVLLEAFELFISIPLD